MTIGLALDVLNGKYSYTTQTEVDITPQGFYSEDSFLENARLRAELIGRTDVLDKVRKFFLIPGLDMMTTQQVAAYYKVPPATITSILLGNGDEIYPDGIESIKIWDARLIQNTKAKKSGKEGSTKFITPDGDEFLLNNNSTRLLSKRAVLRIGMLLGDNKVAKEVRVQLLKCLKNKTAEQKVEDIDIERHFDNDYTKAPINGNEEVEGLPIERQSAVEDRHIDTLNKTIDGITEEKEELASKSDLLGGINLTSEPRKLINRIIKGVAWKSMNRKYSDAWRLFAREVNWQKGIYLNGRRKEKDSLLDVVREDEWPDMVDVALSLCNRMGIDIT